MQVNVEKNSNFIDVLWQTFATLKIALFSESSLFRNDVFSNSKWSYLSLLQAWHLQPFCLSLADLLTQTQHLRQTPRLQSIHSSLRLKSKENPSPQRAQIRWLSDFCFDMRVSISCLLWAVSKSASTCLEKYNWYYTFHLKKKKRFGPQSTTKFLNEGPSINDVTHFLTLLTLLSFHSFCHLRIAAK